MRKFFKALAAGEEGAAMVEYALMVALIAAVLIVAVPLLTTAVKSTFTTVASDMTAS
jgi:Flp pilus assembly pilin Flp